MKWLIVGSSYEWSIENIYCKAWQKENIELELFAIQNLFYDFYYKSIWNKLQYRLGCSNILQKINNQLLLKIESFQPEIVFVFKGLEILPETLKKIKAKNIILANYNPDDPFVFSSKGSGNSNITKSIALYDIHFSYNLETAKKITSTYNIPAIELPFGYEQKNSIIDKHIQETVKVCFLGNPDKERAALIVALANNNILIDVYGNDWDKFVTHQNITIFPPVYGDAMWILLAQYRVQLNIMRKHNLNSHNMRTFEIPGAGGIQLAPYTVDHIRYFKEGETIFLYKNVEEAIQKINFLMALKAEDAEALKQKAKLFALNQGYTYTQRAKTVLLHLQKLIQK